MRNMNAEELKNYIETLTDNEKDFIIYTAIKLLKDDEISNQIEL